MAISIPICDVTYCHGVVTDVTRQCRFEARSVTGPGHLGSIYLSSETVELLTMRAGYAKDIMFDS